MADFMENLNERQREAVLETEGYVRVIAGAGSGKTKLDRKSTRLNSSHIH